MLKRFTIEEMQAVAKSRGGQCLSTKYTNARTKLLWRCAEGHEWEATPDKLRQGQWCRICGRERAAARLRATIEPLQKIAKELGGECLSDVYINAHTKLRWRCAEGHEWETSPVKVKRGHWCKRCRTKEGASGRKLTIEEMQAVAKSRGGQCLSTKYINTQTKLRWRCAEGHEWEAVPASVLNGTWCPTCSQGNSERIVRDIFEQLFHEKFPKVRPRWLVNDRGNQMELDGYCKKLALAFEYHGEQHFNERAYDAFAGRRGTRRGEFKTRKQDDVKKAALCESNDVLLIEIPFTVSMQEVPKYVVGRIEQFDYTVSKKRLKEVKVASFVLPERLIAMQALAKQQGGHCLSTTYVNNSTKLRWRCAEGHEWEAAPGNIQQGKWCRTCGVKESADRQRGTIETMQKAAESLGGRCLSKTYVNANTRLLWQCSKGHEWEAVPFSVVNHGSWCGICRRKASGKRQRDTIEQMQNIAKQFGGRCVSETYSTSQQKLEWQCVAGHKWEATPSNVKRGSWCPKCAGGAPLTLQEMHNVAESRGGRCLSKTYVNNKTKLLWQCSKGHEWLAEPRSVRSNGSWCARCARTRRSRSVEDPG